MSNQGQEVKWSIFDFEAKICIQQLQFGQLSDAHSLKRNIWYH